MSEPGAGSDRVNLECHSRIVFANSLSDRVVEYDQGGQWNELLPPYLEPWARLTRSLPLLGSDVEWLC